VDPAARFIAFLDSDDEWKPFHLQNAVAALGESEGFYFSNYVEPGNTVDAFAADGRIRREGHCRLDRGSNCYKFVGDFSHQIMGANVVETSTVVYRKESLSSLRFDESFRNAFEDHLFWIAVAESSVGIVFSWDVECQYGYGVNIWRGAGFGSDLAFGKILGQCRYVREISRRDAPPEWVNTAIKRKRESYREQFVAECLHRLRRLRPVPLRECLAILKADPWLAVASWGIGARLSAKRLSRDSI
jgi:succinoglycan biosynthesis protein ExoW